MLTCSLANSLWEKISFRNQRKKPSGDITILLQNWPKCPYNSSLLNTLWLLLPRILFWSLWKERNKRIFKNKSSSLDSIWDIIFHNLQESLSLHSWKDDDFPKQPKEIAIWQNWNFIIKTISILRKSSALEPPLNWSPPPSWVVQIKFRWSF